MSNFDDAVRQGLFDHIRAATDGKSLGEDGHGRLHEEVASLAVGIQDVLLDAKPWTPVLHTDGGTDFARGTGGTAPRGMTWGMALRIGQWAWAVGTIRTGPTAFVEGVGNYHVTLPYKAFVPPTLAQPLGTATIGAGFIQHFDMNVHQGRVNNLSDGTIAMFTYDNGVGFWSTATDDSWPASYPSSAPTQVQRIPALTGTSGDIHLRLGPYLIDRT
jgi:hypothetical protein